MLEVGRNFRLSLCRIPAILFRVASVFSGLFPRGQDPQVLYFFGSLGLHLGLALLVYSVAAHTFRSEPDPIRFVVLKNTQQASKRTLAQSPPRKRKLTAPAQQPSPKIAAKTQFPEQRPAPPSAPTSETSSQGKSSNIESLPVAAEEYLVTEMPLLIDEVRITYPEEAKQQRLQGKVVMDLLIDAEGRVRDVKLVSGEHSLLNQAAADAVRSFKFKPANIEGKSVAVKIRYAYRFVLEL